MDKRKITNGIKYYRRKGNYSIDYLANLLDISKDEYKLLESGKKDFSLNQIIMISDLFGIDEYDFLERKAHPRYIFCDLEDVKSIASFNKIVKNYLKMIEISKR